MRGGMVKPNREEDCQTERGNLVNKKETNSGKVKQTRQKTKAVSEEDRDKVQGSIWQVDWPRVSMTALCCDFVLPIQ